ncbi:hypothetical protein [Burkholderia pyrrocinia]|nr:hypothetical protein [Burkholderia pyrrocinia]
MTKDALILLKHAGYTDNFREVGSTGYRKNGRDSMRCTYGDAGI